MIQSFKI